LARWAELGIVEVPTNLVIPCTAVSPLAELVYLADGGEQSLMPHIAILAGYAVSAVVDSVQVSCRCSHTVNLLSAYRAVNTAHTITHRRTVPTWLIFLAGDGYECQPGV
jgi:hypothetical protein